MYSTLAVDLRRKRRDVVWKFSPAENEPRPLSDSEIETAHIQTKIREIGEGGPDLLFLGEAMIVSDKALSILHRLEPDKHQAIPLEMHCPVKFRREVGARKYYYLRIFQTLDAVIPEKSCLREFVMKYATAHKTAYQLPNNNKGWEAFRAVVQRDVVRGCHLWINSA